MHSRRFVPLVALCALALIPGACADVARDASRRSDVALVSAFVDAFGDTIHAGAGSARVVSLNPATTELVYLLGGEARLVGRTRWDAYPEGVTRAPDLGDGMRPSVEAILAARPDLVLLYASEENRAARDALRRQGIATLTQRLDRVADFAAAVEQLGLALAAEAQARVVRDSVLATLDAVRARCRDCVRPRVLWPLWDAPLMAVGAGSFLHELLDIAGAENVFADLAAPSPIVTFEEVLRRDPDVVLVGPNRADAFRRDPRWQSLRAIREGRLLVYDTLLVGRPGVRLGEAADHLERLLRPVRAGLR